MAVRQTRRMQPNANKPGFDGRALLIRCHDYDLHRRTQHGPGETAWGVFVVLWSVILVGNIDNVIRPLFVSRGSAMAFGLMGIFLGPTILDGLRQAALRRQLGDLRLEPNPQLHGQRNVLISEL